MTYWSAPADTRSRRLVFPEPVLPIILDLSGRDGSWTTGRGRAVHRFLLWALAFMDVQVFLIPLRALLAYCSNSIHLAHASCLAFRSTNSAIGPLISLMC